MRIPEGLGFLLETADNMTIIHLSTTVIIIRNKDPGQGDSEGAAKVTFKSAVIYMNTEPFANQARRHCIQDPFDLDGTGGADLTGTTVSV